MVTIRYWELSWRMLLIEMKAFASRMAIDFLGAYIVEYYNRSIQGLLEASNTWKISYIDHLAI